MKLFGREAEPDGQFRWRWRGAGWEVREHSDPEGWHWVEAWLGSMKFKTLDRDGDVAVRKVEEIIRGMVAPLKDLVGT